jgi:surface antigen-like variable number repeat protein
MERAARFSWARRLRKTPPHAVAVLLPILFVVLFSSAAAAQAQNNCVQVQPAPTKLVVDSVILNGADEAGLPESSQRQLIDSLEGSEWKGDTAWKQVTAAEDAFTKTERNLDRRFWMDRSEEGYRGTMGVGLGCTLIGIDSSRALHVELVADIDGGNQVRIKGIDFRFSNSELPVELFTRDLRSRLNHYPDQGAFSPAQLRVLFPVQDGDIDIPPQVRKGVEAVTALYESEGYMDCAVTSSEEISDGDGAVSLVMYISEGPQYRVGSVTILGLDPQTETILRSQLVAGRIYDWPALRSFLQNNKSLFPVDPLQTLRPQYDKQFAIVNLTFDFRAPVPTQSQN